MGGHGEIVDAEAEGAGDPLPPGGALTLVAPVVALLVTVPALIGSLAASAYPTATSVPWIGILSQGVFAANVAVLTWQTYAFRKRSYASAAGWRLLWNMLPPWLRGKRPDRDSWEVLETRPVSVALHGRATEALAQSGNTKRRRAFPVYVLFLVLLIFIAVVCTALIFEKPASSNVERAMVAIALVLVVALLWPFVRLFRTGVARVGSHLRVRSTMRSYTYPLADILVVEPYQIDPQSITEVGMLIARPNADLWAPLLGFRDGRDSHLLSTMLATRSVNRDHVTQMNRWLGLELVDTDLWDDEPI